MNKLSANGYKGIKFFTRLIEIKHMIIDSTSPPASRHRPTRLVDGQCIRGVIGPRDSNQPIAVFPRPWIGRVGGDVGLGLRVLLAGFGVSDVQLAGACRVGFQGVGSAGAVRTRAGPETRRAPPWTLGAGSFALCSYKILCRCRFTAQRRRVWGEKCVCEFCAGLFSFPARRHWLQTLINRES